MRPNSKSFSVGISAALAAGLVLSACGSDSDEPTGTTPAPSASGAASASSAPSATTGATGTPIKLMTITALSGPQTYPWIPAAAKAAATAVNKAGGISGRQVEIVACDEKFTPQGAGDCARQAIDEKVTAVVGAVSAFGDTYTPILEKAGIPLVAGLPNSPAETTSPISYPITGSALVLTAAAATAKAAGAGSVAYLGPNVPAYSGLLELTKGLLPSVGVTLAGNTTYPPRATDYTQFVATAYGSKADAVVPVLTADSTLPAFVNAVGQGGYSFKDTTTILAGTTFTPSALESSQLKDKLNDVYVVNAGQTPTDTSLPGIRTFQDEVAASGEKVEFNDTALQAWVGVHVIAQVLAKGSGDIALPATLIAAMKSAGPINYPGWTPFDWSKPALPAPLATSFPRYFNATVWVSKIVDNKMVTAVGAPVAFSGPITLK
jgi:ABC-type branched-subunit amino acid transport system substrate-binding protein